MDCKGSEPSETEEVAWIKVVVTGGFGVGKTTYVRSVSDIEPLTTEEKLTQATEDVDDTTGVSGKTTTTVLSDFGRTDLGNGITMFLFGTPGQDRFWFLWDDLFEGALGAVLLVDTRRLPDSFPFLSYLEQRGLPFIVAVNAFDDADPYALAEVRDALDLAPSTPLVTCDARQRASGGYVLRSLAVHLLDQITTPAAAPQPLDTR